VKRILLVLPDESIKRLLWNDPRVVVLDECGWWIADWIGESRRLVETFSFTVDWTMPTDIAATIGRLKRWNPIWSRWVADADQYELLYRDSVFYVRHLQSGMRQLGITRVLMVTGISHHVMTSLIELAAAELGIEQAFLYFNLISGRLQPFFQLCGVQDRTASRAVVSDYDASEDIARFKHRSARRKRPKLPYFIGRQSEWYLYGVLNAAYVRMRQTAARVKRGPSVGDARFHDHFAALRLTDYWRILRQQREALHYLDAQTQGRRVEDYCRPNAGRALMIAAHYQPEATSFPEGGDLWNHVDIVIRLRQMGWSGPILYREHFASRYYQLPRVHQTLIGIARSKSYYQQLLALGCVLVEYQQPLTAKAALADAIIPVTISGTIAVERALEGLPTIVSGYPWYQGMPGIRSMATAPADSPLASIGHAPDAALAADAAVFLNQQLSKVTILNAPGLGTAQPLSDNESEAAFRAEFSLFTQFLIEAGPVVSQRRESLSAQSRGVE